MKRKQQIGGQLERYDRQALTFATTSKKVFLLDNKVCTIMYITGSSRVTV